MKANGRRENMGLFLTLAFLFFIGSTLGWIIELIFRNVTARHTKWINPGFCTGPYLPIYGCGLCALYLLASLERYSIITNPFWNKIFLFTIMMLCMTGIEYVAGIFCLKVLKVRLWDYSDIKGNIQGIICPIFSLAWGVLSAIYYFLIHPYIQEALLWLSNNLAFSFVIGMFFGFFVIDVVNSANLIAKLKTLAEDNDVIIRYEGLKAHIRTYHQKTLGKYNFFRPFRTDRPLAEYVKELLDNIDQPIKPIIRKPNKKKKSN